MRRFECRRFGCKPVIDPGTAKPVFCYDRDSSFRFYLQVCRILPRVDVIDTPPEHRKQADGCGEGAGIETGLAGPIGSPAGNREERMANASRLSPVRHRTRAAERHRHPPKGGY